MEKDALGFTQSSSVQWNQGNSKGEIHNGGHLLLMHGGGGIVPLDFFVAKPTKLFCLSSVVFPAARIIYADCAKCKDTISHPPRMIIKMAPIP